MIIDDCEIVFQNKEITQKVTLPCPDLIGTSQSCIEGDLVSGMCKFDICPDGFTDNNTNCRKEVSPAITPCIGVAGATYGRRNNNISTPLTIFFSFINFENCDNQLVNATSVFPTLLNAYGSTGQSISFLLGGVTYNQTVDSVSGSIIYFQQDIFATAYPNNTFVAGETKKSNTTSGLGVGMTTSQLTSATFGGTTWTAPVNNSTVTCTPGSTLIDGKCYEIVNKIQSQEVPVTNTTVTKQKALSQTVVVKKGETKSNISERHAQQLAKDLLNQKISLLEPKCEPIPLFYNTLQTKTAKKNCTSGTSCDITITVNARQFTSAESQEIADNLAKSEVERLFGLSVPCCIPDVINNYLSDSKEYTYSKACSTERLSVISPRGGNALFRGITIPSFTSNISLQDANQKRDNWFLSNKNLFEDLIICSTPDCEGLTIIKTTQKLLLRINGVIWGLERFDTGSFIDDFNELNSEVNNISSYKIKYCTLVPVYAGVPSNILDSTGVNIVSIDKNIITYSYITGSPTFNNGEYQVTIKLQGNTNGASKIFKYGSNNCC